MNILYVNHSSGISGAERSLLELLAGLGPDVSATVACPDGPLAGMVRELRVPLARIPEVRAGLRLHPWFTAIGMRDLARAALALRRLGSRLRLDLIHANSVRAGIVAALAARPGGPPLIVAVNDCLPDTRLANLARRFLIQRSATLMSNSRYTAASFRSNREGTADCVVYNPIDLVRFDPARITRAAARARLGLEPANPVLGVVAQLTPWKGQDDAIRALASLKADWPAARLLLVGDTTFTGGAARYDNRAYRRRLEELAAALRVSDAVTFMGARDDVPEILRALDLLLLPSWEEPFGLAVIEAMAMQLPVVATNVGGPSEIIRSDEDGLLLPPRQPERWAAAIATLLRDPARRAAMGQRARQRVVDQFSRARYVSGVLSEYRETLRRAAAC
jgi:glycosyltransferase involved in cell wall biosynthesis